MNRTNSGSQHGKLTDLLVCGHCRASLKTYNPVLCDTFDGLLEERDSLQAEVERLTKDREGVIDRCAKAEAEVERLRACIWKMVGILGFDQDGAEHHHLASDIVEYGVRSATEARADHEEALREHGPDESGLADGRTGWTY